MLYRNEDALKKVVHEKSERVSRAVSVSDDPPHFPTKHTTLVVIVGTKENL